MPLPPGVRRLFRLPRRTARTIRADVDEELRFHLDLRAAELAARHGLDPEAARAEALRQFGDLEDARRYLERTDAGVETAARVREALATLWQDLRLAWRGVRARPGFAAAVVATLALGIGANAATFSAVDRLLFRPPPLLHEPARTHRVYLGAPSPSGDEDFYLDAVPYARFVDLGAATRTLARTALATATTAAVGVGAGARRMPVAAVTAGFFDFFDAPPALGRYFGAREDAPPAGAPVVVLGWATWQSEYGGRRDVLGTTLRIDRTTYTVIGVAPRRFSGLWPERPPLAYVPYSTVAAANDDRRGGETWWTTRTRAFAGMIAQRSPGATAEAATAELTAAMRRSWAAEGGPPELKPYALAVSILTERGPMQTSVARVSALVGGMALAVLLIACANVANLLLARAFRRRREIAVRLALGVGRRRLVGHLLVESMLLALLGGGAGLLVAQWGGAALRAAILPSGLDAPVLGDARTLAAVGVATLLAGVLTGLAGAWQTRRVEVTRDLRAGPGAGGSTRHRSTARVTLLVMQGALSVLLLVGAGLFVRSLTNARRIRLGFDVAPVLVVGLNTRDAGLDSARAVALRERLLAAARRLPGVERAALVSDLPLDGNTWVGGLDVPGADPAARRRFHQMYRTAVGPDYFSTMGTRIVRGRGIERGDATGAPGAVVVSGALADVLWPGRDALGQCMRVRDPEPGGPTLAAPCFLVVGIAEDVKVNSLGEGVGLYYYLSAAQIGEHEAGIVVRTRGDAARQAEAVRAALQKEMPGSSSVGITPLGAMVGEQLRSWQLGTRMLTVYGALALALAAVGLYAVVAHEVEQRGHEVGVRVALGAERGAVVWLVVRRALSIASAGVALGGVAALAAAGRVAPLLFEVSPRDPLVYALVAAAMLAVAAAASVVPARRAARVDPTAALRSE